MSQIQVNNLSFTYEGSFEPVFSNVSFTLDTDWKLGFIGRNGRGKTTFLKILSGELPYQGKIQSTIRFGYFPYSPAAHDASCHEVARSILGEFEDWELEVELSQLGLEEEILHRPYATLSYGEQTKLLLAILFLREDRFLLIDEPTNHLDLHGRELVADYLSRKNGFILVSHDRTFLDSCIDHVLAITPAGITVCKGNYTSWARDKAQQDAFEMEQNKQLKKDIRRLETAARQAADWSNKVESTKHGSRNSGLRPDRGFLGHKAAKMMQRSKNIAQRREDAIEEKEKLLRDVETAEGLKLSPLRWHSNQLAELRDVSIAYDGRTVCKDVRFTIERGDRIALQGPNGCGKTSILKLICGEDIPCSGYFFVGKGLNISHISQDSSHLGGSLQDYAESWGIDRSLFFTILRKLDFERNHFSHDLSALSAGQQKKVQLARSLCQQAHLYVWDEPLNYVDLLSRTQIEDLLLEFKPTILFVEHDRAFCERVATKQIELTK